RSVRTNLARRFNAGIRLFLCPRRVATIESGFKRRYATRTLSCLFPAFKGRAKFVLTLRVEGLILIPSSLLNQTFLKSKSHSSCDRPRTFWRWAEAGPIRVSLSPPRRDRRRRCGALLAGSSELFLRYYPQKSALESPVGVSVLYRRAHDSRYKSLLRAPSDLSRAV